MSADAWNGSWGASWGQAWGSLFQPVHLGPGPGGGFTNTEDEMFAGNYFGARYFGSRYFGKSAHSNPAQHLGPGPGVIVHELTHSAKATAKQNRASAKLRADIGAAMYRVQDDEDAAILMLLDSPMLSPGYEAAAEAMFQRIEAALEAEDEALKN